MKLKNFFTSLIKFFGAGLLMLSIFTLLVFSVKGDRGSPIYFQTEHDGRILGPFESSGSNSRYALVEAIAENGTFFFDDEQARFGSPDLVHYKGNYFSIFAPGVSILGVPFYVLGKQFGMQQLFTYFMNLLLLCLNGFLVYVISRKLGVLRIPSMIAGLSFMFATNALPYALTFTQHTLSTTIILFSILNASYKRNFLTNLIFGMLFGAGILVDLPNAFMMIPVLIYIAIKNFSIYEQVKKIKLSLKISALSILIGLSPFLFLFGWYNYQVTGSYTTLGQFIGRSNYPPTSVTLNQVPKEERNIGPGEFKIWRSPFESRFSLAGFYTLVLSNERGWIYYSPILFIGILGLLIAAKSLSNNPLPILLLSTGLIVLMLYSMFGDPYGGWAFGPRYMIPAAAVVAGGIGYALQRLSKKSLFVVLFLALVTYSSIITTIGTLTTNSVPTKVEAVNLSVPIPWTYEYNLQLIKKNQSSSLIYNLFLKDLMPLSYYAYAFSGLVLLLIFSPYAVFLVQLRRQNK